MATVTPVVERLDIPMEKVAYIAYQAFQAVGTAVVGVGKLDETVAVATAIAWAESGGNATAHNPNRATGDDSYGLWQINMLGSMGPRRRILFGISSNEKLLDPVTNANAMVKLWLNKGRSFRDWTTYNNGKYKSFLPQAREAVKNRKPFASVTDAPTETKNALTEAINTLFAPIFNFIKEMGLRVAGFVGGGVLLILAIVLYVRSLK